MTADADTDMHVLVGFDESPQAEAALEHALSRFPEAEITVIHVNDPREWITDGDEDVYFSEGAYQRVRDAAIATLETAEELAAGRDRSIETEVVSGRPAPQIVEYAEEHDVDHIVVGSHGRRGLARFLIGSVSEQVVKRAPGSVTVMRTPPEE